jgi:hypothetical protein
MSQAYLQLEERILAYLHRRGIPFTTSDIAAGIDENENVIMVHTALGCLRKAGNVVQVSYRGMPHWMEKGAV